MKGQEKAGHKYSHREWKGGKWVYAYADKPQHSGQGHVKHVEGDYYEVSHPSMYEPHHVLGREIAHNIHDSLRGSKVRKEKEPPGMAKLRAREASPGSSLPRRSEKEPWEQSAEPGSSLNRISSGVSKKGTRKSKEDDMNPMSLLAKSSALIDPKPVPSGDSAPSAGTKHKRKARGKEKGANAHGTHSPEPNASPMGNPDPGLTHCAHCGAKLEMRGSKGKGGYGPTPHGAGAAPSAKKVSHLKSLMPRTANLLSK